MIEREPDVVLRNRARGALIPELDVDICIEHQPDPNLRPFVECIWHSEATSDTRFEIVPDGCVDVCFVLSERRPRTLLFGTTTRTSDYQLEANTPYFGVRFRPGRASLFTKEQLYELTDGHRAAPDFLGLTAERVLESRDFPARRSLLESALTAAVANRAGDALDVIAYAVHAIDRTRGHIRVRALAAACHASERQLERMFLTHVGVTPKLYARIRRFRSVLSRVGHSAETSRFTWADIAAEYGYTDQSHLVRDFKAFAHPLPATDGR
jgi:AraC-like DNA-binding protein